MSPDRVPDSREIYRRQADRYDELVRAEDYVSNLAGALDRLVRLRGAAVVEVGAGTGRVTRLLLEAGARSVIAADREAAMLAVARASLGAHRERVRFCVADATALPLRDEVADLGIAGWVFGHLRYWLPEGWRAAVGTALDELARMVRPGGCLLVIETLGIGCETPHPPDAALAEYYDWLERARGFARRAIRTDFRFTSVEEAARLTGFFFGDAFAERVRENRWSIVPECTGVWSRTVRAA